MEDREEEKAGLEDRLSDLRDNIIHEILSYLDIKQVIQTSVLSKRWKNLWASVPDLNFNSKGDTELTFPNFFRRVLSKRGACNVRRVEFFSRLPLRVSSMEGLINYAVSHQVEDFRFVSDDIQLISLPACKSLKTLFLSRCKFGDFLTSLGFDFANLTSLDLYVCCFCYSGNDVGDPFGSCPNLRSLCLRYCRFPSLKRLKITGFQLVSLEIQGFGYGDRGLQEGCEVEIFAPNLLSFVYKFSNPVDFCGLHFPSLEYVEVHVWLHGTEEATDHDKKRVSLYLMDMFEGFGNAQSVKLYCETIQVLNLIEGLLEQQSSPFKRLKKVEVQANLESFTLPAHVTKYLLAGTIGCD
ncbi:unnamed protein product [Dovyalis caffra]|uniref:F-box domain-containing protein n=1 Tax=Dovyalis caffra TaxID=77055 RepID=A0AAV1QRN0_9ROSI|nr:unnamed protein product [Dovyalis caffra]